MPDVQLDPPSDDQTALPRIFVAVLCDRVMEEKDGVLSIVRIVDVFSADLASAPEGHAMRFTLHGLLVLRDVFGDHMLTMKCRNPAGKESSAQDLEIKVPRDASSDGSSRVNILIQLPIVTRALGRYWLDVYFDGRLLVVLPFKLVQTPTPPMEEEQTSSDG
jgi:hypothetical protein